MNATILNNSPSAPMRAKQFGLPVSPVYFLLVDDLEENLIALEALLKKDGLVLLKARSGTQALELLLKHDVALALVDIQMPGLDGFELAELMRGTERTRRVPIIFLTAGNADQKRRFKGYEAGAVDFLQKPIEPDVLRSKAEVFFALYRQRQEVALQRDELKAATEENIRLLEESRKYAEALKEADRRKDEFLAVLAHELRNPLAPVKNAAEILRLSGADDKVRNSAREIIERQISHMSRLIDDLLDVARIARGKIELRKSSADLVAIVRNTSEDYRLPLSALGVMLVVDLPQKPLMLNGDITRLAQIVGNLLHNAGKFTPRGGQVSVKVSADLETMLASISITDTGVGLEHMAMDRLFEPFTQADQQLARTKGGLGLGLALAKGLVALHGGTISAKSEGTDKGSTFTVTLPLNQDQSEATEKLQPQGKVEKAQSLRILLVEDNEDNAASMKMLLSLLGHNVEVESNGDDGLARLRKEKWDVVISDLGLPGDMDGYAFAKTIRSDSQLFETFLIALSGYGQPEDRKKSSAVGFNQHLVKPVEIADLEQVLAIVKPNAH